MRPAKRSPPMNAAPPATDTDTDAETLSLAEIRAVWPLLTHADRLAAFALLPRDEAQDFFFGLDARDQEEVLAGLTPAEQRIWMRFLAPDDAADLVQAAPLEKRDALLALLDEPTRCDVTALLAYDEDNAGGLMNPRFLRLRPDVTVLEAIKYLHKQMQEGTRTVYYAYVLDAEQHLLGVVSFRQIFTAPSTALVRDLMRADPLAIPEDLDQESVS